ncbi:hypothetical protein [Streptomyces sp. NPDC047453]|uniref:hypothetical protein n=1 Tax=Streptomyces sp. NPDC047453 TaxID=3154812 RepID=UPI0033F28A39
MAALNPKTAGHKKPGVPKTSEAIEWTKRYLIDFGRLKEETSSDRDLYPDWAASRHG